MTEQTNFPTLSRESYTDSGEPIYGGSIGMNRFYDNLVKSSDTAHPPEFRIIVINAMTLIRNNYTASYKELQQKAQNDINVLITYLSIFLRKTKKDNRKVSIILMYPDYRRLPETIRKPANSQMTRILEHYLTDVKTVKSGLDKYYENDVLQIFSLKAGGSTRYPHTAFKNFLIGEIDNENRNKVTIPYRLNEPIHLVSHIALDWHISTLFRNVSLIESFTGEIIDSQHFGSKLIKKKDLKIPFNNVIHQTFGDDTLIKPLAVRKNKKILLDSTDRWPMMTQTRITDLISKTLGISIPILNKYKLV